MNPAKPSTPGDRIICACCKDQAFAGDYDSDLQGHVCEACLPDLDAAESVLREKGFRHVTHNPDHEL